MQLKITWGLPMAFVLQRERTRRDPMNDLEEVVGFRPSDLEEIRGGALRRLGFLRTGFCREGR